MSIQITDEFRKRAERLNATSGTVGKAFAVRAAILAGEGDSPRHAVAWIKKNYNITMSRADFSTRKYVELRRNPHDRPPGRQPARPHDEIDDMAAIKRLVGRHGVDFVIRAARLMAPDANGSANVPPS